MAALRWLGMIYVVVAVAAALAAVVLLELAFFMLAAGVSVAAILCFAMDKGLTLLSEIRDGVRGGTSTNSTRTSLPHALSAGNLDGLEERLARSRNI